jgi:hypothetical protein
MDLARAPRRRPLTARKKGSGYENVLEQKIKWTKKTVAKKYKLWIREGKPRGRDNITFHDYKEAKRLFRKEQIIV